MTLFRVWTLAFLVAAGCCPARHFGLDEDPYSGFNASVIELEGSIRRLCEQVQDGPLRVLLLSGGGSRGAWGAGVLSGWRARGSRPDFHVVTGISTGAIQSTFAYLNTPEDDGTLSRFFLSVRTNDDIYSERGLIAALMSDSIADVPGLRRLIWSALTEETIARVADRYLKSGHVLAVGTADLDAGVLQAWDLGRLAAGSPPYDKMALGQRVEKYRSIVLASASMPVLFPPVLLDGHLHVDGGVREQVFVRHILLPVREACLEHPLRKGPCGLEAYALINGKLRSRTHAVRDALVPLAKRSLELLMDEGMVGSLYKSASLLAERGYRLRVMMVPADFAPYPFPHEFAGEEMRALHEEGVRWGRDRDWFQGIPETEAAHPAK